MAGASDKARFYLEQSVPDLHELVRKKIFSEVGDYFAIITSALSDQPLARSVVHRETAL